jgi:3-oxoacyl-(acyl-carrier-protein) synthase
VKLAAVGVLTGWGQGLSALPADARRAAGDRAVVPLAAPALDGERFRRATRECLLGVAAVAELLQRAGLTREAIRGPDTGFVYVTAGAYGASNRAFIEAATVSRESGGALHFPYTAPSAVPAEVAIEFGLTGRYVILIGGATATLDALWQAERLVAEGACRQAIVLAVETFAECADLYRRARWVAHRPLVEAAAAALLLADARSLTVRPDAEASRLEGLARRRAGETLSCAPLIALALAQELGEDAGDLTGQWRGRRAALVAR